MAFEFEYKFVPLSGPWPQRHTTKRFSNKRFTTNYTRTLKKLAYEIEKLDPRGVVIIEADFRSQDLRLDGQIRSDARRPAFPGVIINFTSNTRGTLRFACDSCTEWQHNIHALALALERLRLVDKDGVTQNGQQYKGWKALPAPEHADMSSIDVAAAFIARWADLTWSGPEVLNKAALIKVDWVFAKRSHHAASKRLHPDSRTPDQKPERWQMLQAAWALIEQMHQATKGGG